MKWVAPALLSLAALVLAVAWGDLPPRWPVHWGVSGQVDGWASKTLLGVFGPLVVGACIWATIAIVTRLIAVTSPKIAEKTAVAMADALQFVQIAVALIFAMLAVWLPFGGSRSPLGVVLMALVISGAGIVGAMLRFSKLKPTLSDMALANDEGWNALYYRNAKDPRLWVPKRWGIGWTINFAHRLAWPMLLLCLSPALIAIVILLTVATHASR